MSTVAPAGAPRPSAAQFPSRPRRFLEGLGFVAVWVGLGYLLPVGAEAYLLLGVPLTIAFQTLIRRRPLRELWVRDREPTTPLGGRPLALVALLVLAPTYWGVKATRDASPAVIGWYAAAAAGAIAAAYALRAGGVRAALRSAALPLTVGVLGNLVVVGGIQLAAGHTIDPAILALDLVKWTAIYFPATFVIEEVAFRGALDSHLHQPGEARGWQTALLVSTLWGLWHLPVAGGMPFPLLILSLVTWHCAIGIPLSLAWRRTGNLSGPALAHSVIDAVRNGVLGL